MKGTIRRDIKRLCFSVVSFFLKNTRISLSKDTRINLSKDTRINLEKQRGRDNKPSYLFKNYEERITNPRIFSKNKKEGPRKDKRKGY